jgi:hypothetical protein
MPAPELIRTPEEAGQILARCCIGLPESLFLESLASVMGEIEGALLKAGHDLLVSARLAGTVQRAACQEWQRLHAFSHVRAGSA